MAAIPRQQKIHFMHGRHGDVRGVNGGLGG